MSEQDIVRNIIDAVNTSGLALVWRCQSGLVKVRGAWMHLSPRGTADVIGYMLDRSSRIVGLEVKKDNEKPTPVQEAWRARVLAAGGVAACVRSVTEALAAVRAAARGRA